MGWWSQAEDGRSFAGDGSMVWGDEPADLMGDVLNAIALSFQHQLNRYPTVPELEAGLRFSANADPRFNTRYADPSPTTPPEGMR